MTPKKREPQVVKFAKFRTSYGALQLNKFDDGSLQIVNDPDDPDIPRTRMMLSPEMQKALKEYME